jgi:hypothetical protein
MYIHYMCGTKIFIQAAQHVIYMNTPFYVQEIYFLIAHSCSVVMRCGVVLAEEEMSETSGHARNRIYFYCTSKLKQAITEACGPILKPISDSFHIYHTIFLCGASNRSPEGTSRSHSATTHSVGSSGQLISSTQRPLPDNTQHTSQRDIQTTDGFRTHNPSERAAADQRLRPRGDRLIVSYTLIIV